MHKAKIANILVFTVILGLLAGTPQLAAAEKAEKVRLAGTVEAIDLTAGSFTVADRDKNMSTVFVNPATEFEIEKGKGFFADDDVPFTDLRAGDWVKVKSYRINGRLEADDVEIYRSR